MDLTGLFKEYGDKQEMLSKLRVDKALRKYNNSELHIIAAIGDLEHPNVTALAEYMKMTKGGISKNMKKLATLNLVEAFQLDDNSKNIYYRLTKEGEKVYALHDKAHKAWLERDRRFMADFSEEQLKKVADFMERYIAYLDEKIQESEKHDA